jgi:F-type H+-transporting ATPase subunit b
LSINVSEVIWTIVCFFALLFVLKKFLFDPLIRFMEQRQAAIDQGLERGRDAQRKKDENDAALREKWKERSVEVKQLLAEGKTADDRERAWVLESTQKETNKALQEANQRIEQERRQVCADAQEQLPQLVSILAQQLLSGDTGGEER